MKTILPLSKQVIAKIAAGEVIERPAYAVKELIENALDANAISITIHIEASGLKKIVVSDNGTGMNPQDLKEAFKLHTTSKLATLEHLEHIATFGFRGEALASIAAISHLTLQSRIKNQSAGTQIEIVHGKIVNETLIGMPVGTTITVANLFQSVPGRKKFLKSPATEFRHIVNVVTQSALANPSIHFQLSHNKKILFDLPSTTSLSERIHMLLGYTLNKQLLPLFYKDSYISISGFITRPQQTTSTSNKQFLFVNSRKVYDKFVSLAIKDAYGTLLDPKSLPVFILFLTLPYELVDVNVHPRKEQVRFSDSQLVTEALRIAVAQTLVANNLTFFDDTGFGKEGKNIASSYAGRVLKENQIPWDIRPRLEIPAHSEIIQLHNLYLVTQTRFGMMLVDQHAAHERILYEQFSEALQKNQTESAQYHFPKAHIVELALSDMELIKEHQTFFKMLGFELEVFKRNSILLHAVPLLFQDRNPQQLLLELLEDLEQERTKDIDAMSKKMLSYLACRAAIKAGESLTKKQAKELMEKLEKTSNNATCPHGRPTRIIIDTNQLHKMFKRK
jgi:DNA mismatch repair protein MutL